MALKTLTAEEKRILLATLKQIYDGTPYFQNLPCQVADLNGGEVTIDFPVEQRFCYAKGVAAPGLMMAFCDTLMGFSCRTLGYSVTTLEINMNYVRHVRAGECIRGVGTVVREGDDTNLTEAVIYDADGRIVVKGRASFYILKKPGEQ